MTWFDISMTLALVNYGTASLLSLSSLARNRKFASCLKVSALLFFLATIAVSTGFVNQGFQQGWLSPSTRNIGVIALVSTFTLWGFYWLRMGVILILMAPIATLMLLFYTWLEPAAFNIQANENAIAIYFHIAGAFMGELLAGSSVLISVMYLWQHRSLKLKKFHSLPKHVPSLELLARILTACLWTGFVFLTSVLLSGFLYLDYSRIFHSWQFPFKILWAMFFWGWFTLLLVVTHLFRGSSHRIAQLSAYGFVGLLVVYFFYQLISHNLEGMS